MKSHHAIALSLTILTVGCHGIAPANMKPAGTQPDLQFSTSFSYEETSSFGVRWKYTVKSGSFRALREDESGIYFHGGPQCLGRTQMTNGAFGETGYTGKLVSTFDCGIFLPTSATQSPKIYIVHGSEVRYPADGTAPASSNFAGIDSAVVAAQAAPNGTPLQVGVGAALGDAIGQALLASQYGNFEFYRVQPKDADMRRWLAESTQKRAGS